MGGCTASCQTATLSDTQNLTVGGPAASGILFVAAPSNTSGNISEGDLKFSLTLSDGVGPATTVYAYMEYYANVATGLDDMQWSGGAVATPAYVDLAHGTNYTQLVSLSDNRKIAVTFNYENDWNMAQTVSFQAVHGTYHHRPARLRPAGYARRSAPSPCLKANRETERKIAPLP